MMFGVKNQKKLFYIAIPIAFLFFIVIFLNPLSSFATISNGMLASDVIGQQGSFITELDNNPTLGADSLSFPHGIVVDHVNHRLFVSDYGNIRVLVYNLDSNNDLVDTTADYVLGQPDFVTAGPAYFDSVEGLEFDSIHNRLFVADRGNNRILVFDTTTITNNENAVYVLGQGDFTTHDPATSQSGMDNPNDVTYDSIHNRLFVVDANNNRVLVFGLDSISNGLLASNVIGQTDFSNNGASNGASGLTSPHGVEYDFTSDRLFVSDTDNDRVMVFDVSGINDGEEGIAVLGQPDMGTSGFTTSQSGLHGPTGMSHDSNSQRLFVSDTGNRRVMVFDVYNVTNGEDAVNVIGQADFTTQDNSATQSNTNGPRAVAYDPAQGHLYIADTNHKRVLVFDNVFVSPVVLSTTTYTVDGTYRDGDTIYVQVVFNTLVTVTGNPRIQLETGTIDRYANYIAGSGSNTLTFAYAILDGDETSDLDYVSTNSLGLNGGSIITVDSNLSADLTLDNIGGQYSLAEQKNIVIDTTPIATIYDGVNASDVIGQVNYTDSGNKNPVNAFYTSAASAVAMDSVHHRLFVSDGNSRVLVFNLDTNNILIDRTADYVLGQANFTENVSGPTQGGMSSPKGLAYDSNGDRLFVADSVNKRVVVFDTASISNGEDAVYVLGQADFTSSDASTSASLMAEPTDVAFDSTNHRLFVVESFNNRILIFDTTSISNGEDAVHVLGQLDFNHGETGVSASEMWNPVSIDYDDSNERLFVTDQGNNRVLVFDVASISDGEDAINVLGQYDFISNNGDVTQSKMVAPSGVTYDSIYDRLFVSDRGNNRILVYNVSSVVDGEDAVNVLGQENFITASGGVAQSRVDQPTQILYDAPTRQFFVADSGNSRVIIWRGLEQPITVTNTTVYNADGTYREGDTIYVQVVFNAAVTVTGTPRILLQLAHETQKYAEYSTGSGTNTLIFTYTIVDGDSASQLDYVGTDSLELHGGTIQDLESNNVSITLSSPGATGSISDQKTIVIDNALSSTIYDGVNASDVLGQVNYIEGHPDLNASAFSTPFEGVIDPIHHRLFVSDSNNFRVLVFNLHTNNVLIDRRADYVLGQTNFTQNNENLTQNGMSKPYGIAYDSNQDRLFVSDYSNSRILVFDTTSISNGESAVHVLGQVDFISNHKATSQSMMSSPIAVTFDVSQNRLFVTDNEANRVLVFDTTSIVDGEEAVHVLGQQDFESIEAKTSSSGFKNPTDTAYDATNRRLFVSDAGSNRVLVFDTTAITDGESAVNVLGQEDFTTSEIHSGQSGITNPYGLAYDSTYTRLFVSDTENNRILIFDMSSVVNGENAVNVLGQSNFENINTNLSQGGLYNQSQLDYDAVSGQLFVADQKNHRVVMFRGLDTAISVSDVTAYTASGTYREGDTIYVQVVFNAAVTVTGTPRILLQVGETSRYATYYLGSGTNILTFSYSVVDGDTTGGGALEYGGTDSLELDGGTILGTVSGNIVSLALPVPGGAHALSGQKTIIINTNLSFMLYDGMNASDVLGGDDYISLFPDGSSDAMRNPSDVTLDTIRHRMFIVDTKNHRVLVFNLNANNILIDRTADYILGGVSDDLIANSFSSPNSVAYDSTGDRLFVGDSKHARVLVFDTATIVNNEDAVYVIGQPDFTTQLEPRTPNASVLSYVGGLVFDYATQALFVSDSSNNRVLVFDVTAITSGEAAVHVLGQNAFNQEKPNVNAEGLSSPFAMTLDDTHHLFVADQGNNRVLVFDITSIVDGQSAVNVLGQGDFISNYPLSNASAMTPSGVAYDPNHHQLFVSDMVNNRILIFDVNSITNGENALNVLGQRSFRVSESSLSQSGLSNPSRLTYLAALDQLFVSDTANNRVVIYQGFLPQPMVTNVTSSTLDGTYSLGDDISIQVIFNKIVNVIGTPILGLETGVADHNATYTSGTGTSILNFLYTIVSGDSTSDLAYTSINALSLEGGSIKDTDSNDALLTLSQIREPASLDGNKNIVIDALAPTVSLVTSSNPNGVYTQNNLITVRLLFTESVFVTGIPQLTLETGTTDRVLDYQSGSGGTALNFAYVVQDGDYSSDLDYKNTTALSFNGGTILDSVGNVAVLALPTPGAIYSLGFNKNISIDARPLGVPYIFPVASSGATGTVNSVCNYGDLFSSTTGIRCLSNNVIPKPITPTKSCPNIPLVPLVLKLNVIHNNVKILQQILNCKGYVLAQNGAGAPGEETNKFAVLTYKAVVRFQKDNALIADGIVGPKTMRELNN